MVQLSDLRPDDRETFLGILVATERFSPDEVAVALELFDLGVGDGATAPRDPEYLWVGARSEGRLIGAACYGPMPGTDGTFDLYWIVVHPHSAGAGAGSVLLRAVEGRVCEAGGRLLVVETSGRDDYDGARGFYLRRGYILAGRIADFYAPGDDRLILTRRIREAIAGAIPVA